MSSVIITMAAPKSLTQICRELGDVADAVSDVASQHSSGSGSTSSGSGSGASSVAPSVHEAVHEAIQSPLRDVGADFDDVPVAPFEDPVPEPVLEGEALPRPLSPHQSPLPAPKPVQRRVAKQDAIKAVERASPVASPRAVKVEPEIVATPNDTENSDRNKQLITYVLIPTLAFAATYFGGPMIVPSLFENKTTGEHDAKKALLAATLAACGAALTARCVL